MSIFKKCSKSFCCGPVKVMVYSYKKGGNVSVKRCIFAIMAAMLLCGCSIKEEPDTLAVSFFDVGKADSFLMTCGGKNLLMDAGTAKDGKKVAKRLEDMGVESIDYLMITHFDRDHAGGAAQIIQDFDVKALLRPEYMKESDESAACMAAAEDRGVKVIIITSQTDIQLGSTKLVIHPADKVYENDASNNSSLVTEVFHGNNSLLFTGDIEKERIADIKYELNDAGYDFLKVPHHGRYEKILPEFFSLVGAQSAVITSSEKNPEEQETIQALEDAGVKDILLTRGGEITLQSDGRKLSFTQK